MAERLKDPTGNRFTRCPMCHEWRGVGVGRCAKCGKSIPKIILHEASDGTVTTSHRVFCDECAEAEGVEPDRAGESEAHGPE